MTAGRRLPTGWTFTSGELVAVAKPDARFAHYYWLGNARTPDFARGVEIHSTRTVLLRSDEIPGVRE